MLQVDSHVWNQIAPLAKNPVWKARMQAKDNDALIQEMQALGAKLRDQGVENKVILAYQVAGPLLAEQAAIRTFLRTHPQYSQALPQMETPNEAILLMIPEYHLSVSQTRALRALLVQTPPA
jgi:hypothetical protein